MKQGDRCKGRKESLEKGTDALDTDEHFDVIALMLGPPASCFMWGGSGSHVALNTHSQQIGT